jgi:hypothetical protein
MSIGPDEQDQNIVKSALAMRAARGAVVSSPAATIALTISAFVLTGATVGASFDVGAAR